VHNLEDMGVRGNRIKLEVAYHHGSYKGSEALFRQCWCRIGVGLIFRVSFGLDLLYGYLVSIQGKFNLNTIYFYFYNVACVPSNQPQHGRYLQLWPSRYFRDRLSSEQESTRKQYNDQ